MNPWEKDALVTKQSPWADDPFVAREKSAMQVSHERQDKILGDIETAFEMYGEDTKRILQEEMDMQKGWAQQEAAGDPESLKALTVEQTEQQRIMDWLTKDMSPEKAQDAREWGAMEKSRAKGDLQWKEILKEREALKASWARQDKILQGLKKRKIHTIEIRGGRDN